MSTGMFTVYKVRPCFHVTCGDGKINSGMVYFEPCEVLYIEIETHKNGDFIDKRTALTRENPYLPSPIRGFTPYHSPS